MEFTLGFASKIGKNVTLSDDGGYYCGDYYGGRYYTGRFGGIISTKEGIYFIVDDEKIKVSSTTKIKFDEKTEGEQK